MLAMSMLALTAGISNAANITVDLEVKWRQLVLPNASGGTSAIGMWGFIYTNTPWLPWAPGPTLRLNEGDNLTINLKNNLANDAVSIVIPGQTTTGSPVIGLDGRVRSFTSEAATGGGLASYTWSNLKAGTYLYQSGSHPALQVPMGLYGALIVDSATVGAAYTPTANNSDTAYTGEVVLLYSEIDRNHHADLRTAKPLNYIPEYYLVNGRPYEYGTTPAIAAGAINQNTLVRFLNAGLKTHVPTLLNTAHMKVIAEDGNLYPYAKQQYSVMLPAGKTIDAIWHPTSEGVFRIIDHAGNLTNDGLPNGGMLAFLRTSGVAVNTAPVAVADSAVTTVNQLVNINLIANDTDAENNLKAGGNVPAGRIKVTQPALGGTVQAIQNGARFTPSTGFTGATQFTYQVMDIGTPQLLSNVATVDVTVN